MAKGLQANERVQFLHNLPNGGPLTSTSRFAHMLWVDSLKWGYHGTQSGHMASFSGIH